MSKTIKIKKLSDKFIELLENMNPLELKEKYGKGDYLYIEGIAFVMVYYDDSSGIDNVSDFIVYWSELYDAEINLFRCDNEVEVITPSSVDWTKKGF